MGGKSILFWSFLAVMLTAGIALRLNDLDVPMRSPDEKVYSLQAGIIARLGQQGTQRLVQEYNKSENLWIYPPPTRIGYTYLLASLMKIANTDDVRIGAYLSTFFSIAGLFLFMILGLRFFNRWAILAGLLFLIVSPMDLAVARRCWQDSILMFSGGLLIYLCCEMTRDTERRFWQISAWLVGIYCILIKESGLIIYLLCVAWIVSIMFFRKRSFRHAAYAALSGILGIAAALFIISENTGGVTPMIEVFKHVKEAMPNNIYAIEYQTGPWYGFIKGLWSLAPVSTLAYFGTGIYLLSTKDKKGNIIFNILYILSTLFIFIVIFTPYCQNLRYISVIYAPFYLIGGFGMQHLASFIRKVVKNFSSYIILAEILFLVLMAACDYAAFRHLFINRQVPDLSIKLIKYNI